MTGLARLPNVSGQGRRLKRKETCLISTEEEYVADEVKSHCENRNLYLSYIFTSQTIEVIYFFNEQQIYNFTQQQNISKRKWKINNNSLKESA